MELNPYLEQVQDEMARTLALADDQTRQVAERLVVAVEPALRLAFVQALSDAAAEVTAALDGPVVEVRMAGRDPRLAITQAEAVAPAPAPGLPGGPDEGTARITLRLPEAVKSSADEAAQQAGVSLNTWITNACRSALTRTTHHTGRRVSGWA